MHAVADLAATQLGLVTRAQLVALGVGRGAIAHGVAAGWLHRVHAGVYAVGHQALPPLGRELAALLACGPGAVVSHRSAAAILGLLGAHPGAVELTYSGSHRRGPAAVLLHRSGVLEPTDVWTRGGVRLTSPARTLVDLAAVVSPAELGRAINEAQVRRLVRAGELATSVRPGRRGTAALQAALDHGAPMTHSQAERLLLTVITRAELPRPQTNVRVLGFEVDALWPARRLVVEADGYAVHSTRAAFERDRRRDAELQASGHRVLRITWRQLTHRPEAVAARIAAALSREPH